METAEARRGLLVTRGASASARSRWPEHSTEETVRTAYADWARDWREDGPVRVFAARDPETNALVGGCELRTRPDDTAHVAYWTHAAQRGRGYARNALALLLGYAISIGITRLRADIATDNHASRRVAGSVGCRQESTFTEEGTEMARYGIEVPGSSE